MKLTSTNGSTKSESAYNKDGYIRCNSISEYRKDWLTVEFIFSEDVERQLDLGFYCKFFQLINMVGGQCFLYDFSTYSPIIPMANI